MLSDCATSIILLTSIPTPKQNLPLKECKYIFGSTIWLFRHYTDPVYNIGVHNNTKYLTSCLIGVTHSAIQPHYPLCLNNRTEQRGFSAPLPCFTPRLIAGRCMSDDVFNKMLIKSASLQASAHCSSAATLPDINVHALSYLTLTLHAQIISSLQWRSSSTSARWHYACF